MDWKELHKDLKKVPNQITFSRLLFIPFILIISYFKNTTWFIILYIVQWQLDSLDGYFARKLKQTSVKGAYYDGIVDEIDVFFTIIYLYLLFPQFVIDNIWIMAGLWSITLINRIVGARYHGKDFRLHLLSGKYSISFFHIFVIYIAFFKISYIFFYFAAIFILIFQIEELLTLLFYRNIKPDIGSIVLLMKDKDNKYKK